MNNKKLYRSESDKMLGGVCSGLGHYLNIDPTILRLGFAVMGLVAPQTILLYLILWVIIPPEQTTPPSPPMPPAPPSDPTSPSI